MSSDIRSALSVLHDLKNMPPDSALHRLAHIRRFYRYLLHIALRRLHDSEWPEADHAAISRSLALVDAVTHTKPMDKLHAASMLQTHLIQDHDGLVGRIARKCGWPWLDDDSLCPWASVLLKISSLWLDDDAAAFTEVRLRQEATGRQMIDLLDQHGRVVSRVPSSWREISMHGVREWYILVGSKWLDRC